MAYVFAKFDNHPVVNGEGMVAFESLSGLPLVLWAGG